MNTRGYISRIDLDTRQVVAQSPILRQGIMEAVVNPEGTRLLTWYTSGSTLYVLDTSTLEVLARLKCGTNLGVALFSHDGRQAIVSAVQSRRVCIVDMESLDVVHKIAFPKAIGYLSLHPSGELASASAGVFSRGVKGSAPRGSHIFLFDPRPGHNPSVLEAGSLVSGRHPRGSLFLPDGRWLVTANRLSGDLSVTDLTRGMVTELAVSGRGVERLVPIEETGRFIGINRQDAHISVYGTLESGPVLEGDIYLSGAPYDVELFEGSPYALATILGNAVSVSARVWHQGRSYPVFYIEGSSVTHAEYRNGLSLIDIRSLQEVDFMKVGRGPVDVAIHPRGHMAAIACAQEGSIDLVY